MKISVVATIVALFALADSGEAAAAAEECAKAIPYGIATRPEPDGTLVAQVLPPKLGRFTRDDVPPKAAIPSDEDFNVTYRAGKDSIFIGLSRVGSAPDLREAVRTSREDVISDKSINRKGEIYCVVSPPFFYKIPDFIAWTRGPYFLYAHASSPAVLAEFMKAFPY